MGGNTINLQSSSFRIFVSFATADRDLAEHLAIGLRRNLDDFESVYCFTKPGRYNSKGGSRPSDNFIELIDESLRNCNIFLLLWSIHARSSKGVIYELNQAKHFAYMQNTKRLGKEFKILPICIDKCGLPQGLKSIVRVNYSTGENPQITLNQVLDFLDCPPENDHPSVIVVKQAIFELRTAFRSEDWQRVVQQYPNIFDHYHAAISANTHYMYAIALIKQERIAESLTKMQEGLALVHQKGDAELLYIYAQCLKERWRWNEVRFLAEKTMLHFPNDARWQKLLLEAFSNSTIPHSPYPQNQPSSQFNGFTTAHPLYQNQLPPQFNQVTGTFQMPQSNSFSNIGQVGSSGINGTTHSLNGDQTHSSSPLQQAPLGTPMGFPKNPYNQSNPNAFNSPTTEQLRSTQGDLPLATEEPAEEEYSSEITGGFWYRVQHFFEEHLSYEKLRRMLTFSIGFTAFLNSLCFLLVSLMWSFTTFFMGGGVIVMFLILYLGRTVETMTAKVLCILSLCVLWGTSGYCLGYMVDNWWGWGKSTSFATWVEVVCTLGVIMVGSFIHLKLFCGE